MSGIMSVKSLSTGVQIQNKTAYLTKTNHKFYRFSQQPFCTATKVFGLLPRPMNTQHICIILTIFSIS